MIVFGTRRVVALMLALPVFVLNVAIVAAQVPPQASDVTGYAGIHAAAHAGDLPALEKLLTASRAALATLEARDGYGRTALHIATHARHRHVIAALIKAGANHAALERDRYDAVTIAAVANDEETLRLLLSLGASAKLITSRYDGTALIAAAHLGHDGVVRQLIQAGAPLDHINNLHWTALIEAIVLGDGGPRHQRTLQALLDAGASTRITDRQGRTPLQLARSRGYDAMVKALVAAGAR